MNKLSSNPIRLFWWNEVKIQGKPFENYGDLLGKYLVEKISNRKVVWVMPSKFSLKNLFLPIYVTTGSILTHITSNCIVWGSGIISKDKNVKKGKFLAVRGPQTRNYLLNLGYDVPEVYGDPGILLPLYYSPTIKKKYKFGIVPHYNDFKLVEKAFSYNPNITIINLMTDDIEDTTNKFLECERIISSSLHGIITAHTYGIPAVWQRFSDKPFGDNIKYQDYFESIKLKPYLPEIHVPNGTEKELGKLFTKFPSLPDKDVMISLRQGLLDSCPFYNLN